MARKQLTDEEKNKPIGDGWDYLLKYGDEGSFEFSEKEDKEYEIYKKMIKENKKYPFEEALERLEQEKGDEDNG